MECTCDLRAGLPHHVSLSTFYRHQRRLEAQAIASQIESTEHEEGLAENLSLEVTPDDNIGITELPPVVLPETRLQDQDDAIGSCSSDSAGSNLDVDVGDTDVIAIAENLSNTSPTTSDCDNDYDSESSSNSSHASSFEAEESMDEFDYESIGQDSFSPGISKGMRLLSVKMSKSASEAQHDTYVNEMNNYMSKLMLDRGDNRISSYSSMCRYIAQATGIVHKRFDCCIRSCIAFTGTYKDLERCPKCDLPRWSSGHKPYSTLDYIPVIHRLRLQYSNPERAKVLGEYRDIVAQDNSDIIGDFSQTDYFRHLQSQGLFQDSRDLAFSLYTDGINLFKVGEHTVSPVILINLNLPLDMRFRLQNILLTMVVPGPHEFQNINSWFGELIREFTALHHGVPCWDAHRQERFMLRAHICLVLGDQPAASKLMGHSGHMHYFYCRHCLVEGIRAFSATRCPHRKPHNLTEAEQQAIHFVDYDLTDLPLCDHREHLIDARQVDLHMNQSVTASTGIKYLSILFQLPTVQMPISSPPGIMHAIFEGLEPLMWGLWSDSGVGQGHSGMYTLTSTQINEIGSFMVASAPHWPSAFGRRLRNIAVYHGSFKASDSITWLLVLSPVMLAGRLPNPYYTEWTLLIRTIKELMQPFSRQRLPQLRANLVRFVDHFETDYYQFKKENLRLCRTCIHYILHLADAALHTGVLSHNWEFVIERYVGRLKSMTKSRYQANRNVSLNSLTQEQLNHLPYICQNPEIHTQFQPCLQTSGLLTPPASLTEGLPGGEYTKWSQFLASFLDVPQYRIKALTPSRSECKIVKYFRYRNDIHTIGCKERREAIVNDDRGRANYYVRYLTGVDGQAEYGSVRYFAGMPNTYTSGPAAAASIQAALVDTFRVVCDEDDLTLVTDFHASSSFICCSTIDGLVGLLLRDNCYFIVDADSAFLFQDE